MSATRFGPPYRPPCDGWEQKLYLGCADNFRSAENHIPEYINVTKVPQDPPGDMMPVTPFPRPYCLYYAPPCSDLAGVSTLTCNVGDVVIGDNCYQSNGLFLNLAKCAGQIGFKNAMAYKVWQGGAAYTCLDNCDCGVWEGVEDVRIEQVSYISEPLFSPFPQPDFSCCHTPLQSKPVKRYLKATITGHIKDVLQEDLPDPIFSTATCIISLEIHVDKLSGNVIRDSFFYQKSVLYGPGAGPELDGTTVVTPNFINSELEALILNRCPLAVNESNYYYNPTFFGPLVVTVSDNTYTYSGIFQSPFNSLTSKEIVFSVQYDEASIYTGAALFSDWTDMLAVWDLSNDIVYPWRTDGLITSAPFVVRDEKFAAPLTYGIPPAETSPGVPWTDPDPHTGALKGVPTPAGYHPFWNKTFQNWTKGYPPGYTGTDPIYYIESLGQFSPSWCPHATNWTDVRRANDSYPGSWAATASNGLIGMKWSETYLFAKPSHNFDRPCGEADRTARDQTTINCDTNPTGDLRYMDMGAICGQIAVLNATIQGGGFLIELAEPATGLKTGDLIDFTSSLGVVEVAALPVTVIDATHFTVVSTVRAPFVQSHGAKPFYWNDTGVKGNFISQVFEYDYRDVGEISRLQTQYLARVRQNELRAAAQPVLPETLPPCDVLPNPSQIRSGVPLKNISIQTECVSFSPCQASVMYCSPNTEGFANGFSVAFPVHIPDFKYGSRWQQHFYQWMIDPMFQTPVCPCADRVGGICNYILAEDDGSCGADEPVIDPVSLRSYKYYQVPYEEALGSLPVNPDAPIPTAPALPLGLRLGCVNVGTADAPNWVGPECQEIPYGQFLSGYRLTPWVYWLKQLQYNCPNGALISDFSFE